jgi:hypothetical protein
MSYICISDSREFYLNDASWENLLELARINGWEPEGTIVPFDAASNKDQPECADGRFPYWLNDYRKVTTTDARKMADALERSLDNLPNHDALEHKLPSLPVGSCGFLEKLRNLPISPMEFYSGSDKQRVRNFIDFARAGSFAVTEVKIYLVR